MNKITTITVAQAPLPESIPASQRPLPGEIVYPFFTWLGDCWAGWRDAALLKSLLSKNVVLGVTPWMNGLRSGFLTSVARDRRETIALQAPLRDEAASIVARYTVLQSKGATLEAATKEATDDARQSTTIDAQPTSAGEAYEKPEQIRQRRQKEANTRLAAARADANRAVAEREAIIARLAKLKEAFDFHEAAHTYRVEALRDFYAKRQSVYVRRGLHGLSNDGCPPTAPNIDIPDWKPEEFPVLSESMPR